ncbi:hypothetical protein Ahu01nite_081880 [Winogradskya humida]|uniref:Uncharacterized protein n=1 Tax=Winogradskya humida TaxID=113566 RepID=A0ABQ4A2K0_9ACTN|nr:hypothetical protein Ahu01nite_081880 [Actinoplanes humidus]
MLGEVGKQTVASAFSSARKDPAASAKGTNQRNAVEPSFSAARGTGPDRAVRYAAPRRQASVYVEVFSEESLNGFDPVAAYLVIIVDEINGGASIFPSTGESFWVNVEPGIYSFYMIMADRRYGDALEAPLYGLGLPFNGSLPLWDNQYELSDSALNSLVLDAPIEVDGAGPLGIQMVILDANRFGDDVRSLANVFGDDDGFLTGDWAVSADYPEGDWSRSSAQFSQRGNSVMGVVHSSHVDNGSEIDVQQLVHGSIDSDGVVLLKAYEARIFRGPSRSYWNLDTWRGKVLDSNTVEGSVYDVESAPGYFLMARL